MTTLERIAAHSVAGPVVRPEIGACIDTTYNVTSRYPRIRVGGKHSPTRPVSHFVLEAKLGRALLPGMRALHHCDRPVCVNAAHLYEGTQSDNMRDCMLRGRRRRAEVTPEYRALLRKAAVRGAAHPKAKLTDEAVIAIRHLAELEVPLRWLADAFGVTYHRVRQLAVGQGWSHLTEAE